MGLKLETDCGECLHRNACRNLNNAKDAMNKLANTDYGNGPNDDYYWKDMLDFLHVDIKFSCPDYENIHKGYVSVME